MSDSSDDDWDAGVTDDEGEEEVAVEETPKSAPAAKLFSAEDVAFQPVEQKSQVDAKTDGHEKRNMSDPVIRKQFMRSLADEYPSDTLERFDEKSDALISRLYQVIGCGHRQIGYDTNKPFIVDLDSLLLDLFSDPLLAWDGAGGEFLQLMFLVEQSLVRLSSGERAIHVVAFDALAVVWREPSKLLARTVVLDHLRSKTKVRTERFASWWCDEFNAYLREVRPTFILVSDGDLQEHVGAADIVAQIYQRMTLMLLARHTSCVRISEISYYSNAMYGFRLSIPPIHRYIRGDLAGPSAAAAAPGSEESNGRATPDSAATAPEAPIMIAHIPNSLPAVPNTSVAYVGEFPVDQDVLKSVRASDVAAKHPRLVPALYGSILSLKKAPSHSSKAKLFLAHSVAQLAIGLKARPQRPREGVDARAEANALRTFVDGLCLAVLNVTPELTNDESDLACDLIDGRLLVNVALLLKEDPSLALTSSPDDAALLASAWAVVAKEAGFETALGKLTEDGVSLNAPKAAATAEAPKPKAGGASRFGGGSKGGGSRFGGGSKKGSNRFGGGGASASSRFGSKSPSPAPSENGAAGASPSYVSPELPSGFRAHDAPCETLAIHLVKSPITSDMVPEVEDALKAKGLLAEGAKEIPIPTTWQEDGLVPDGLIKKAEQLANAGKRKKWIEKADSKYLSFMQKYSASLAGSKIVLRDVIVAPKHQQKSEQKSDDAKPSQKQQKQPKGKKGGKKGGGGGGRKGNKGVDRKAAIQAKVVSKQKEAAKADMLRYIDLASQERDLEGRIAKLDSRLISVSSHEAAIPGQMKLIGWCMDAYAKSKPDLDKSPAVRLFQITHDIFRRFALYLSVENVHTLQVALHMLGFTECAQELAKNYVKQVNADADAADAAEAAANGGVPPKEKRKRVAIGDVYLKPQQLSSDERLEKSEHVGITCRRFQLEHAGHLMVRNVESQPDPRVTGFYPDKWQRELLDVVDNRQSCLVVAPTSSGKTFISYYTMKQILFQNKTVSRSTDRGFVVFVCPTKALVNQAAADVFRRYGRVFGIYTLDYDIYALDCEVLITVPEGLERMLLSPQREQFAKQIQYVIFDEVHSIGDPTGGEVWERIILMLQCPFVALSATLGNPDSFHRWLRRVQNVVDRRGKELRTDVRLITHTERWSDLEKYMYVPDEKAMFPTIEAKDVNLGGGITSDAKQFLRPIHPLGAYQLGNGLQENEDLPADLRFSAKDCSALYNVMRRTVSNFPDDFPEAKEFRQAVVDLDPEKFFTPLCISKGEVLNFERKMKEQLVRWRDAGLHKEVETVLKDITSDLMKRITRLEGVKIPRALPPPPAGSVALPMCAPASQDDALPFISSLDGEHVNPYSQDFVRRHFIPLLVELDSNDKLPVLVFSMDWNSCEVLVKDTLDFLESLEAETLKKEGEKDHGKSERERKKALKLQKRMRDAKKHKGKRQDERDDSEFMDASSMLNLDIQAESAVDPRFSFCRPGEMMDSDEMDFWIARTLKRQGWNRSHPLIRCLARGIGVHHAGLTRPYRSLVETLFRARHLKVVVTTETLSLGVNMPCRSTIFAGDSPRLTPLRYRQMMGRSGRRGYDNVGHVIFFGIPPHKISYLMTSSLLSLHGNFALTTTTALRGLIVHAESADKRFRLRAMKNLLQETFSPPSQMAVGEPEQTLELMRRQIQHDYRFSLEYLIQIGIISNTGKIAPVAGLVSHLYASEPANFAFAVLLRDGVFDDICESFRSNMNVLNEIYARNSYRSLPSSDKAVCKDVLAILAHLFFRVPFPANFAKSASNTSRVTLDPLPPKARAVLAKHNSRTVALFTQYCRVFAQNCLASETTVLPLSGTEFNVTKSAGSDSDSVAGRLAKWAVAFEARSPFVALSGHSDAFHTSAELMETVNHGIKLLETDSVPCVDIRDARRRHLPLNAYALDFFDHGGYDRLLRDNSLVEGYAWDLLKEWSLILKSIKVGLQHLLADHEESQVYLAFSALSSEFTLAFASIGSQHAIDSSVAEE